MKNKLTLLTVVTIATIATVQGGKADEVQGTATTGDQPSGITVKETGEVGAVQNEGAKQLEQGNIENPTEEAGNGKNAEGEEGKPTGVVKNGVSIQVIDKEGEEND